MVDKYFWTEHAKFKMRQYGLSEQRIKRVLRSPFRKEEGIAKDTVAVMQPVSSRRVDGREVWKQEFWVMYKLCSSKEIFNFQFSISNKIQNSIRQSADKIQNSANQQIRVISAWRYPGVSPKRNPIPEEILREIEEIGL